MTARRGARAYWAVPYNYNLEHASREQKPRRMVNGVSDHAAVNTVATDSRDSRHAGRLPAVSNRASCLTRLPQQVRTIPAQSNAGRGHVARRSKERAWQAAWLLWAVSY